MLLRLIIAAIVAAFTGLTFVVVRARRKDRALRATTQPCIVPNCGTRIPKKFDFTDAFCASHWLRVPRNLKQGIIAEATKSQRSRRPTDAWVRLMKAAVKSVS